MKRISFLMMAFVMTIGFAMAQAPERGQRKQMDSKERIEKRTERMVKEYGLNDAQKARLQELNASVSQKMEANQKEAKKEEREQRMAEMKKNQEEYQAAVKEIFTAEQFQKYQADQAEREKKMKEGRKGGNRAGKQKK